MMGDSNHTIRTRPIKTLIGIATNTKVLLTVRYSSTFTGEKLRENISNSIIINICENRHSNYLKEAIVYS